MVAPTTLADLNKEMDMEDAEQCNGADREVHGQKVADSVTPKALDRDEIGVRSIRKGAATTFCCNGTPTGVSFPPFAPEWIGLWEM